MNNFIKYYHLNIKIFSGYPISRGPSQNPSYDYHNIRNPNNRRPDNNDNLSTFLR